MVLPEPSLTSNTGMDAGAALDTGFFGMEGAAGSFTEPLPGVGPFLSALAFSLSTEAGVRISNMVRRLNDGHKRCRKENTTKKKKASDKNGDSLRLWEIKKHDYGTIKISVG